MKKHEALITRYMDGFRRTDREQILSCLTDDVEWVIPGVFHARGKDEFGEHILDEGFTGRPDITVTRLTEEDDVVVAEGSVRAGRTDGSILDIVYCDVFEIEAGRIRRLITYLMETR